MQCTAAVSSNRFRHTLQKRRLWCAGSDQQCATGFLIKHGATPEHGVTTFVTHFSWTIKLQTVRGEKFMMLVCCFQIPMRKYDVNKSSMQFFRAGMRARRSTHFQYVSFFVSLLCFYYEAAPNGNINIVEVFHENFLNMVEGQFF